MTTRTGTTPQTPTPADEERTRSALAHFAGILSILGPLLVWLVLRDRSAAVTRQAKESLNFQITITIISIALYALGAALALVFVGFVFFAIAPIIQLLGVIFAIVGGVRTLKLGEYRYPLALRLVR